MKKYILILIIFISCKAISQQIYFQQTLYEYSRSCLASDIIRVDSTNYLVTGNYSVYGAPSFIGAEYINKLDQYGNVIDSIKFEHKQDSAGNYYEVYYEHYFAEGFKGDYFSALGLRDTLQEYILLSKLNKNHDTIFTSSIGSKIDPIDSLWPGAWKSYIPREMKATLDGGVVIISSTNGLYRTMSVVTKVDSLGNTEWEYKIKNDSLNTYPNYYGVSLAVLPDTTYIAAYDTHEGTWDWSNHIILKKLDKYGNVIKSKSIGNGQENRSARVRYNIKEGNVYLAYAREYYGDDSNPPSTNYYKPNIMKLDIDLNIIWNKFHGRSAYESPVTQKLVYASTYVSDFLIEKSGEMTILGNVTDHTSLVNHIDLNYLLKLDSNGDSIWFKAYDFPYISGNVFTRYTFSKVVQNDDNGFTISTNILTDSFQYGLVFRVDSMGCPDPTCRVAKVIDLDNPDNDIKTYPNPASDYIIFERSNTLNSKAEIKIYSILGDLLVSEVMEEGMRTKRIDLEKFKRGVYFYKIDGINGLLGGGKLIKE